MAQLKNNLIIVKTGIVLGPVSGRCHTGVIRALAVKVEFMVAKKNSLTRFPLVVTAAIIRYQEKILIAKRSEKAKFAAGLWEFPGGKIEFGESPQEGLKREIKEELDLEINVGELLCVTSHVYDQSLHVILLVYRCSSQVAEAKALEVEEFRWISVDQLNQFTFAAADIEAVTLLRQGSFL